MLEARGLTKSFGKVAAVRGVSFGARDGQITGLLGPNGAGKSTTLRMLYTVLRPDGGTATVDGVDVAKLKRGETLELNFEVAQNGISMDEVVVSASRSATLR